MKETFNGRRSPETGKELANSAPHDSWLQIAFLFLRVG